VLFHRTLRRVRSEGNAGHGRGAAGMPGPPRAAKLAALPPAFWPEAGAPASPGTLPGQRGVEARTAARSRSARPATAERSDSGECRCRWPAHLA
jgi:hypothetical protein